MASSEGSGGEDRKDPIASIAGHMTVLSTYHHSLLRRMYLTESMAAEGVVVKLLCHAEFDLGLYERDRTRWNMLAHLAALLSGTAKGNPHNPDRNVGVALQESRVSENRLLRLTAARGRGLEDQVSLAVRRVAKAGKGPVNLRTLFDLLSQHPDQSEKARRRIARDYYAAKARSEGEEK